MNRNIFLNRTTHLFAACLQISRFIAFTQGGGGGGGTSCYTPFLELSRNMFNKHGHRYKCKITCYFYNFNLMDYGTLFPVMVNYCS